VKTVITSNITKVAARYQRMARNLPGVTDKAVRGLIIDDAIPQFEKTVRTWTHQPRFTPLRRQRGWAVEVDPVYPYQFVNRGTRVRRALMSRDWSSKTKPNVIASYKGSGRMLFVSRRLALPGIKARNFQDIILRRVQAKAANTIREALKEASYGAGMGL
jgi:hypothetical protein